MTHKLLKAEAQTIYPYRFKDGRRVFYKKGAGVQVQINLTLQQAKNLVYLMQVCIEGAEHHIKSNEEKESKK